jgi:hypothetical protein
MRNVLLLLCIFGITTATKAQNKKDKRNWKDGYYYDLTGKKHIGLISWTPPHKTYQPDTSQSIYFADKTTYLETKVNCWQLRSFVTEKDSFVTSRNKLAINNPIVQVTIADDSLKVYSLQISVTPTSVMTGGIGITTVRQKDIIKLQYVYGPNPDNLYKFQKKTFVETATKIMAKKPKVVAKIKNEHFKYGELEELISYYVHYEEWWAATDTGN